MSSHATDTLLAALRRHIGRKCAVSAADLCREARITDRLLRALVVDLRRAGHHVCAHPAHGYFLAASAEELDETCLFLYHRAMCSLEQIAAMKRVSVPDLHGQLRLPT